jgi:hypothetical protein
MIRPHDLPCRLLFVAVTVELIRPILHPDINETIPNASLVAFGSILATIFVTVWSMPETLLKVAVSAFFTVSSMFTVLLVTGAFIGDVIAAAIIWLRGVISGLP